jgi:CRISPR-associated protein Cas2
MADARVFAVFCYDIARDKARARISALLEEDAVRIQESVFEGWMSEKRAQQLARKAWKLAGPDDRIRLYMLSPRQALRTQAFGAAPPVEADDFHLL